MSPSRLAVLITGLALALALASPAAAGWSGLPACGGGTTSDCIMAVSHDSTALAPGDAAYGFTSLKWTDPDGTDHYNFSIVNGTSTLSTAQVWQVELNLGGVVPGETFARGQDVDIVRDVDGSGNHTVEFTMRPVRMAYGGCNSAGSCVPVNPDPTHQAYIDGWVDDLAYVTDPDDRLAMHGFDLSSNADWVSSPLQLDWATNSIELDVANSHFESDGTTVFQGHAEFRLPNPMLTQLYHVDDPSTLTPAAFAVTGSGTAATTSVDVDPGSIHVVIDGMTFSRRALRIRGHTNPLVPRELRADRTSLHRAVIRSSGSKRRGSLVRGYRAVCKNGAGDRVVAETTTASKLPIHVSGLQAHRRYECTVRAKSHAGLGVPGTVTIPRNPS